MSNTVGIKERVMGYDLPSTEGSGVGLGGGGVSEEIDMVTTGRIQEQQHIN